jgi:hypothetical protein
LRAGPLQPAVRLRYRVHAARLDSHHYRAGSHQGDSDHTLNCQRVTRHSHEPEVIDHERRDALAAYQLPQLAAKLEPISSPSL